MNRIAVLPVVAALMLAPSSAAAQTSSTCQAYNPQLCTVSSESTPGTSSAGTLPFTGLDAALLVGGGATILGTGVVVRLMLRRWN